MAEHQKDAVVSSAAVTIIKPSRVVQCTDGPVEIFEKKHAQSAVVIKTPWTANVIPHALIVVGTRALAICDYLGEKLAFLFGITSPKYQYEIEEYYRQKKEDEDCKKKQKDEYAGWQADDKNVSVEVLSGSSPEKRNFEDPATPHPVDAKDNSKIPKERF